MATCGFKDPVVHVSILWVMDTQIYGNYTEEEDEEGTLHTLLIFILHGSLPLDYQPSMRSLSVLVFLFLFLFFCYFCDGVTCLAKRDSVLCLAKRGGVFCLAKRDGVFV